MADTFDPNNELIPPGPSAAETVPPGEEAATAAIVRAVEATVRAAAKSGPARRDAHAKAHGCVKAEFRVLDGLPDALRVGLFAEPRAYQAWIRFSNGSGNPQADKTGDGRGMAIKVMGVAGSRSGTQDFLMINNPTFFVRDAADYVDFNTASPQSKFFFPGWNPFDFRLRELLIARSIVKQTVLNPLNLRYWTMVPFALGGDACKFSARPAGPPSPFVQDALADYLRDNLVRHLTATPASFDFMAQRRATPATMPIEDPRIEWSEAAAPFTPVARIAIEPQAFDGAEQRAMCESLSFTPWHGLEAHRPLGGINRVRRAVYETISRLRHDLNATPRQEPAGF